MWVVAIMLYFVPIRIFRFFFPHFNCLQFVCWFVSTRSNGLMAHGKLYKCKRQLFRWPMFSFRDRKPRKITKITYNKKQQLKRGKVCADYWMRRKEKRKWVKNKLNGRCQLDLWPNEYFIYSEVDAALFNATKNKPKRFQFFVLCEWVIRVPKISSSLVLSRIIIARCWHFGGKLSQSTVFCGLAFSPL